MPLHKDLREFIGLLNSAGVEYLIVGGVAVAWHGYPRFTGDIDFLIRPSTGNADAVLSALRAFGFGSPGVTREDLTTPDRIVQLGTPPNRIDLITSIAGVEFEVAWAHRVAGQIDGLAVHLIGLEELIRNKESTGRPRDLGDADELRKRNPA
jgi:predicted nucleotidyltransferase